MGWLMFGVWMIYGLGLENENLFVYVVFKDGFLVVGILIWSSGFFLFCF